MNENEHPPISPEAEALAVEVLNECRATLMIAYRYLDVALWRMPFEAGEPACSLCSNGVKLFYNPELVLDTFMAGPDEMVRDMLHSILHCIFRQNFDRSHTNVSAWWLASDIMTEAVALDIAGERFPSRGDEQRRQVIKKLQEQMGSLKLSGLYRLLSGEDAPNVKEFQLLEHLFLRDDHHSWVDYVSAASDSGPEKRPRKDDDEDDENENENKEDAKTIDLDGEGEEDENQEEDEDPEESSGEPEGEPTEPDENDDDDLDLETAEAKKAWDKAAKEMETEVGSFGTEAGDMEVLLVQLEVANRKKPDYRDFLNRFATRTEEMKINDDEFDYIFYTYGLELYGNMPLVEPLEYQETERVRDFVVALDTSGSTQGELVKKFALRTAEILRENQSFGKKVNIHIVQCDAKVRHVDVITTLRDLEHFEDTFTVHGNGGTDFRPVFEYVDELQRAGRLDNLQGLIYFTDGEGTYPTMPTPYKTAFVFMDEGGPLSPLVMVPPWAMKVIMDEDDIREL